MSKAAHLSRLLAGYLLAPVLLPLYFALHVEPQMRVAVLVITGFYCYGLFLLAGIPLVVACRAQGYTGHWHFALAGAFIGFGAWLMLGGNADLVLSQVWLPVLGAVAGMIFWLAAVWRSPLFVTADDDV